MPSMRPAEAPRRQDSNAFFDKESLLALLGPPSSEPAPLSTSRFDAAETRGRRGPALPPPQHRRVQLEKDPDSLLRRKLVQLEGEHARLLSDHKQMEKNLTEKIRANEECRIQICEREGAAAELRGRNAQLEQQVFEERRLREEIDLLYQVLQATVVGLERTAAEAWEQAEAEASRAAEARRELALVSARNKTGRCSASSFPDEMPGSWTLSTPRKEQGGSGTTVHYKEQGGSGTTVYYKEQGCSGTAPLVSPKAPLEPPPHLAPLPAAARPASTEEPDGNGSTSTCSTPGTPVTVPKKKGSFSKGWRKLQSSAKLWATLQTPNNVQA